MLLEIMVVTQIVVVDELVALVHLSNQFSCFTPPQPAVLIIAHKTIGGTDAQEERYLHLFSQS